MLLEYSDSLIKDSLLCIVVAFFSMHQLCESGIYFCFVQFLMMDIRNLCDE
jgi:hypothetical protein